MLACCACQAFLHINKNHHDPTMILLTMLIFQRNNSTTQEQNSCQNPRLRSRCCMNQGQGLVGKFGAVHANGPTNTNDPSACKAKFQCFNQVECLQTLWLHTFQFGTLIPRAPQSSACSHFSLTHTHAIICCGKRHYLGRRILWL